MSIINVGYVQMLCTKNKAINLSNTIDKLKILAKNGANIVCLQELFLSHYFCDEEDYINFNLAEDLHSDTSVELQKIASELGIVIIASLFEKRMAGIYHNTTVVIDADGKQLGFYRKMHIPDDPNYYEKFYFTPGEEGYKVFKTKFAKIGVLICWDQWYPEAARITALMGAEILFYPTAIGWATSQSDTINQEQLAAWQTIQKSHAIANGVFVVSVNRIGFEQDGKMQFWGNSFIANPIGKVIYQSTFNEADNPVVPINLEEIDFYRVHWPFLRDRRIDSYAPILNRAIDK